MDRKRLKRLVCVLISNGTIFLPATLVLLARGAESKEEVRFDNFLGAVLCAWSLFGLVAEILQWRWAKAVNIALPASLAAFLFSMAIWLPRVSTDGDRFDAALVLAFFAILATGLTIVNYFAYRYPHTSNPTVTS
jgi:hypothetical protein